MVPELQQRTHNTQEAHKSSARAGLHQMDRGNERDKHGQEVSWVIYKGSHQRAWLPLRLTHPGRVKTHTQANIQCGKRRLHLPRNVAVIPRSNLTAFAKKNKKKQLHLRVKRKGINLYSQSHGEFVLKRYPSTLLKKHCSSSWLKKKKNPYVGLRVLYWNCVWHCIFAPLRLLYPLSQLPAPLWDVLKTAVRYNPSSRSWICHGLSFQWEPGAEQEHLSKVLTHLRILSTTWFRAGAVLLQGSPG